MPSFHTFYSFLPAFILTETLEKALFVIFWLLQLYIQHIRHHTDPFVWPDDSHLHLTGDIFLIQQCAVKRQQLSQNH